MSTIIVKLSGGEEKRHFIDSQGKKFKNKREVQAYLRKISPVPLRFITSPTTKLNYVVYPNEVHQASPSSLKYGTKSVNLNQFVEILRKQLKVKKLQFQQEEEDEVTVKSLMEGLQAIRLHNRLYQEKVDEEINKIEHQFEKLNQNASS